MSLLTLEDPTSLRVVVAETDYAGGGGWRVSVSAHNFLYTTLKENPKIFIGMIFRVKEKNKEDSYARITNALPRWVPSPKRGDLPFLEYLAVRFETINASLLDIIAMIEDHRQKTEGDFKDEPSENQGN